LYRPFQEESRGNGQALRHPPILEEKLRDSLEIVRETLCRLSEDVGLVMVDPRKNAVIQCGVRLP